MGRDRDTEGASADATGTAEATDTAGDRTTDCRALVGAAGVRAAGAPEAGAGAGIRAVVRGVGGGWARDDRCTGGAPPRRPDAGVSFATGRTGSRFAEPGAGPGPGAEPEPGPGAGSDRVRLAGGTAEAVPGRRTCTVGSAARCTGVAAPGRAAPAPRGTTGRVGPAGGTTPSAPSPADPTSGRTGAPGTVAPEAPAGPPATGAERRTAAGRAGAEGATARGPDAGTGPGAGSRRTDGSPSGREAPAVPRGVGTAPGSVVTEAASRCTGVETSALRSVEPAALAEFTRVGTTGRPGAAVTGTGTAPLAPAPEPEGLDGRGEPEGRAELGGREELEEPEGLEEPASGTGPAPAVVGPRPLGAAPSATARRCTGSARSGAAAGAGAGPAAGATGPGAGRAGGDGAGGDGGGGGDAGRDGGALGRPPAAGERCTRGVWPGAGAPACRRAPGAAAGFAV